MRLCDKPCNVIWYCDAPPHSITGIGSSDSHFGAEKKDAERKGETRDWVSLCKRVRNAGHKVHVFLPSAASSKTSSYYCALAEATGGRAMTLHTNQSGNISRCTVGLFLTLEGENYEFDRDVCQLSLGRSFKSMIDENDNGGLLPMFEGGKFSSVEAVNSGPPEKSRQERQQRMADRFATDPSYRDVCYKVFAIILQVGGCAPLRRSYAGSHVILVSQCLHLFYSNT